MLVKSIFGVYFPRFQVFLMTVYGNAFNHRNDLTEAYRELRETDVMMFGMFDLLMVVFLNLKCSKALFSINNKTIIHIFKR